MIKRPPACYFWALAFKSQFSKCAFCCSDGGERSFDNYEAKQPNGESQRAASRQVDRGKRNWLRQEERTATQKGKKWETDSAEITARYPNWKRRKEKIIKQAPLVSPLLDSPAGVTLLKFPLVSPNKLLTRRQFVKERDYGELQEACVLVCVFIRVCKCTAP